MRGQLQYPKPETPALLFCREGLQEEKPPLFPEVAGSGSGKREAVKPGPDAALSRETSPWSFGWLGFPTSPFPCPPPSPILGPPTPRQAPGPAADICGSEFHISSMKLPLPPVMNSVLWSCLLLVCQIAVLMLSAMSDQSADNTTG